MSLGTSRTSRSATCFAALGLLFGLLVPVPAFMPPSGGGKLDSAHGHRGHAGTRADMRVFLLRPRPEEGEAGAETGAYERLQQMYENDGSTDYIFANNRAWVEERLAQDPDTFKRLAKSQKPRYMYIGCSDSRVPAQNMMGLNTGELFVVRNVANLCVNTDHSLLAALAYAVNVLEVTDIIVCGHYGCGGVRAAMENIDHGLLEHWLLNIRNVVRLHNEELQGISDMDEKGRRLVELNVQESCINLFANPIVQKKQATSSMPKIHGWAYDVGNGLLNELDIDFKAEIRKYRDVYRLYEFPRRPPSHDGANGSMVPRRRDRHRAVDPKVAQGWAKNTLRDTNNVPRQ
ncbi:unnamed protein product [Ectocarpus sp. 4 AP-2014]